MSKKKQQAGEESAANPIVIKVMQAARPGDIVFIEMHKPVSRQHLDHIAKQFKDYLPEIRCVILNGDARVCDAQTLATIADKPA